MNGSTSLNVGDVCRRAESGAIGNFPNGDYKLYVTGFDEIDDNIGKIELRYEVKHHDNTVKFNNF